MTLCVLYRLSSLRFFKGMSLSHHCQRKDRSALMEQAGLRLLFLVFPATVFGADLPLVVDHYGEIRDHLVTPAPEVETPWQDLTGKAIYRYWNFDLTIDERGVISTAKLTSGHRDFRDAATRIVLAVRFKPFSRDGRVVPAFIKDFTIGSRYRDYSGPEDRTFPVNPDLSKMVFALKRTSCFGSCPDYRVELRGNGEVHYFGFSDVLVRGAHKWRVDPATIVPLVETLRRANYFALKGYYEYPVTDLPTYITRLSIDDQHKFVLDYGGSGFGGAAASTRMGGEDPQMPSVVTEIENAIDRISGATSYVLGDETTLQRLRDERWNFRSRDAGHGLRRLLSDCNTTLASELIRAGAPVNIAGNGFSGGLPINYAARCADVDIARLMVEKGALASRADAKSFLWASSENGDPGMVTLALKHYHDVNAKDDEGDPLLNHVAASYAADYFHNEAVFDSARVVKMLIGAGANPNARDKDGKTPIFEANEAAVTTALLNGGADPNARDNEGRTALFDHYFDEPKKVLVAAGTDVNARDKIGRTALFYQDDPVSINVLLDGGADVEVVDVEGRTAIEMMQSERAVAALLAAGAKLPADRQRINSMIDTATKNKWVVALPLLEALAAHNR